jgi:hypothetical protein
MWKKSFYNAIHYVLGAGHFDECFHYMKRYKLYKRAISLFEKMEDTHFYKKIMSAYGKKERGGGRGKLLPR